MKKPPLIEQGAKWLHGSRAGRHFYGTENEIWACFGPDGNTEKNGGLSSATFEGVSLCFYGHFFFLLNIVASALKSCMKRSWDNQKKTFKMQL